VIAGADLFSVAGSVEPLEEKPRKRCARQKAEPVFRVNRKRERHGRDRRPGRVRAARLRRGVAHPPRLLRPVQRPAGRSQRERPPAPPPTGVGERRDREGIAFSSEAEPDLSHIFPARVQEAPEGASNRRKCARRLRPSSGLEPETPSLPFKSWTVVVGCRLLRLGLFEPLLSDRHLPPVATVCARLAPRSRVRSANGWCRLRATGP
jgi:hypothetical protein